MRLPRPSALDRKGAALCVTNRARCRAERQISIPEKHARAVAAVLACTDGRTIRVADLPLENDAERMDLALMLHEWGALPRRSRVRLEAHAEIGYVIEQPKRARGCCNDGCVAAVRQAGQEAVVPDELCI